jgi:hypothetical protein
VNRVRPSDKRQPLFDPRKDRPLFDGEMSNNPDPRRRGIGEPERDPVHKDGRRQYGGVPVTLPKLKILDA